MELLPGRLQELTATSAEPPRAKGPTVGALTAGGPAGALRAGHDGPTAYWHAADIKQSLQALLDRGATVNEEVKDVGGGRLVGSVKDADGNVIGLLQDA